MHESLTIWFEPTAAATLALLLFVATASLAGFATFRLSRKSCQRFASIAVSERVEDPRDE